MRGKAYCWAVVAGATVIGLAGCGGNSSTSTAGPPLGDAGIQAVEVVAQAGSFQQPLDAAPSPDGSVMYFIATVNGAPAVLSASGSGGAPTIVAQGAPLAKPTGIGVATDGSHLYLADQQATPPGVAAGSGAILTVPATGTNQTPTVLPGTQGRSPRGIDVVNQGDSDTIYFTGTDPANGAPGLFEVATGGGTITTIAEGAPFVAPNSVVVSAHGIAYVTDPQGTAPNLGLVFSVQGGTVTPVVAALTLGSPAGVTLIDNDAIVLISSMNPRTGSDQVLFFDLKTGKAAAATKVIGAHKASSGGLHRAYHAKVLGWADVQGTVYRVRYP